MNRKNVLILATVSGFLDKFEKGNVKLLQEQGYTVHYAANQTEQHYPFEEEEIKKLGVRLHHIDIARSPYLFLENKKAFWQLVSLIKEQEISVLHCHTPVGGVLGRLAGWYFGQERLKVIYTAHGFHFYKGASWINNTAYYWIERFLARFTDSLVVINQEDLKQAKRFSLRRGGRVYQIPGVGLDLERFTPLSYTKKEEKREALGINKDEFFLVSVGELNENKNQQIVLEALVKMREQGADISKIRYGICGDGFYRERLIQEISRLGLEKQVRLYGYCNQIEEILGCADSSIFPSKREGLGVAGLEALAMGIPLIASDNRGTREYMKHGKNGFVCPADSAEGFAFYLGQLLAMEEKEREEMGQICRQSVCRFGRECTEEIMRQVYQDLEIRREERELYEAEEGKNQCSYGSL